MAAFQAGYESLEEEEQRLFRTLGGFARAPMGTEHITAVFDRQASVNDLVPMLDGLVLRSMLRWEQDGRYRLHALLHDYAAALLHQSGQESTVLDRHAAH